MKVIDTRVKIIEKGLGIEASVIEGIKCSAGVYQEFCRVLRERKLTPKDGRARRVHVV
jgi:hypothetical protein